MRQVNHHAEPVQFRDEFAAKGGEAVPVVDWLNERSVTRRGSERCGHEEEDQRTATRGTRTDGEDDSQV